MNEMCSADERKKQTPSWIVLEDMDPVEAVTAAAAGIDRQ